jgi:hypothetical protein
MAWRGVSRPFQVVQYTFIFLACGIGGGCAARGNTTSHTATATTTSDPVLLVVLLATALAGAN